MLQPRDGAFRTRPARGKDLGRAAVMLSLAIAAATWLLVLAG